MKLVSRIWQKYEKEPINVQFKSRNLGVILLIVIAYTLFMSVIHISMGRMYNFYASSFPALVVTIISFFFLYKGKFALAGTLALFFLSLTPLGTMMVQDVSGYRDIFMYFFFGVPVLILSVIAGKNIMHLYLSATVQLIGSLVYYWLKLKPAIPVLDSSVISGIVFSLLFYFLSFSFLIISYKVEYKIMRFLQEFRESGLSREKKLNELLESAGRSLFIGEQLSSQAEESYRQINDIDKAADRIVERIGDLKLVVEKNNGDQKKLKEGRDRILEDMKKQTGAVSTSAGSVEEMTASVKEITNSAKDKYKSIEELIQVTRTAEKSFEETELSLQNLETSAEKVLEVLNVIEDISASTNLLAMNAAIEAAHAGDSGKGFSVVAEEIRKLAEQTNQNASLTRDILNQNNKDILHVLNGNKRNREHFQKINIQIKDIQMVLEEMINGLNEISIGTDEINAILGDLSEINDTVSFAVEDINSITDNLTANSDSIDRTSQSVDDSNLSIKTKIQSLLTIAETLQNIGIENTRKIHELNSKIDLMESENIAG